ncbi:MAG: hypothetical protein ACRD10_07840 [Terriglobia bacterium]
MAWNQLHELRHPPHRYQYVDHEVKPSDSKSTLEIETPQGAIGRVIRVNGAPPSEKQCHRDSAELARLAKSRGRQRSYFKDQRADLGRRETLFELMPKALLFQFDGVEKDSGWIRLKYRPNPAFSPQQTVGGVLKGLEGTVWVDPKTQRLAKINGHLIKPVTIGWGILAKLDSGGHFAMDQSKLPDGNWRVTALDVHMRGSILLFKKLNVNMTDTFESFKEVADNLTVEEAVKVLNHVPSCSKR